LLGFFFAFWEYVMKERGGLKTLILDDPQELLDSENRRRLADSFGALVDSGAQLVRTLPTFWTKLLKRPDIRWNSGHVIC
jgi:hypothetical protein